jgi:hypothetical protein
MSSPDGMRIHAGFPEPPTPSRTVGALSAPVACDIVPARNIYPIEVSDLNAFRFIPI